MANLDGALPIEGELNWAPKLNTAIETVNDDLEFQKTDSVNFLRKEADQVVTLTALEQFLAVDFPDESTETAPNRLEFRFNGTRTGYFNEYGEGRFISARNSTVALRCFGSTLAHTANIFEVAERDNVRKIFTVSQAATVSDNPVTVPHLVNEAGGQLHWGSVDPGALPVGSIWLDTSGA